MKPQVLNTLPLSFQNYLMEVSAPPKRLYVYGENIELLEKLPNFGLAVVGTRKPNLNLKKMTYRWVSDLKTTSLIVISGLAKGIDFNAHLAACEAHIPTIAVLGSGFNIYLSDEQNQLKQKILKSGGLILTEYSADHPPQKFQFLKRNRLIAGLSRAVLVVHAPKRSGSMNTARWAIEMNKDLYTVPCTPGQPSCEGNQELLDSGQAYPFWGVHNLGATWLDLASLPSNGGNKVFSEKFSTQF